jgi:hypothetical protein
MTPSIYIRETGFRDSLYGCYTIAPYCEEVPTTFQVGIVCSDGILLASDQKVTYSGGYRNSANSLKIRYKDGNIACCAGGGPYPDMAAESAINDYREQQHADDIGEFMDRLCKEAMDVAKNDHEVPDSELNRQQGTILIAQRVAKKTALWRVDVQTRGSRSHRIARIRDRCFSGDEANSACFFTERYRGQSWLRPMDDLLFLAAHTVYMANKVNQTGVDGLDILLCRDGNEPFEFVARGKIDELARRSEELDMLTERELIG